MKRNYINRRSSHQFIVGWRKYGTLVLLLLQALFMLFLPTFMTGFIALLWLTVPCGIKIINSKWYLWYTRQILFATFGILYLIS